MVQSSCISACCFQGLILPSPLLSPLHLLPPNHVGRWNEFFFLSVELSWHCIWPHQPRCPVALS